MRRPLLLALIAMVLGPLVLLALLAQKTLRDEEALVAHRLRELLEQRLEDSRAAIDAAIRTIEVELVQDLEATAVDRGALRDRERHLPLIRQIFVVDSDGHRLQPQADDDASADEREFLARTRAIWEGKAELARVGPPEAEGRAWTLAASAPIAAPNDQAQAPAQAQAPPQAQAEPSPASDSLAGLAKIREQGWISWYWEEGLHLLFWRRRADGLIAGAEIERAALLQRLIDALPATGEQASLIAVTDAKGATIYQWGLYDAERDEAPRARLALDQPLETWSLHYFGPAAAPIALASSRLLLLVGLGGAGLILLGLAVFVHREWSRNMRDARQRVGFVTQVSHELKTPLTNIRLYAELLADELSGVDERAEEHAGVIVSESQRLSRLIANVLTFSGREQPRLRSRAFDLGGLLRQTVEHFGPAFAERGLVVELCGEAPRPVLADEDAVGQILANLLSNVEKYAASGGRVDLLLDQDPEHTRLCVRDYGPGIPSGQRRQIFTPFFRGRSDLTEGVSGTGIGLTIARDLARRGGGDLRLRPASGSGDSPGACFELTLKTAPPPTAEA